MPDEIKINGVSFTPRPDCAYKNNYVNCVEVIETPSLWYKAFPTAAPGSLGKELVERSIFRNLVLTDLWFIVNFILQVPSANHPFVVKMCQVVENGPRTGTLDIWSRGHYKALDINEPVPTPDGWKRHGDLSVGDYVFGSNGLPVMVSGRTEVFQDADCYRITLNNGYSVIVSGDHLWEIEEVSRKRKKTIDRRRKEHKGKEKKVGSRIGRETIIRSTRELAGIEIKESCSHGRKRFAIKVASPLDLPEADLPIDPYALGYWLGDGTSSKAEITVADDDMYSLCKNLTTAGYIVRSGKYPSHLGKACYVRLDVNTKIVENRIEEITEKFNNKNTFMHNLQRLGLINNKHVPRVYLRSSEKQRMALLQGLLDSDGHAKEPGTVYFINTNESLANAVFELATSLGFKATLIQRNYDNKYRKNYRTYTVTFQAYKENTPFRLKRKMDTCKLSVDSVMKWKHHYISAIERVETIPVSCIQVDAADGIYLVGKHMIPTHNSTIITAAETIQYHLKTPEYCSLIMSYKKGLAEKLTDSTRRAYEMEFMQFLFPDELYNNPSVQAPVWSIQNGITIKRKNTTRREPTIYASGLVEGMAQGFHVERRILDDFETEDMKNSPDVMNDVFDKYEMSQFLGTKTDVDVERIIGTIYSHLGPIMRVRDKKNLDGTPMYHCRIVPGTEGGDYDGKPVLWSQETLDKEKTQVHYAMQVLCDPTPKKLRKLNSEFLIEIEPELIPRTVLKFMIVDPAGESNGKKGCDWAILVIGVDPKTNELGASNVYLMNALIDDLKEAEAPEAVARMYLGSGIIQKMGVEKVAQSTAEIHIASMLSVHGRRISVDDGTLVILRPAGRNKMARIEKGLVWPLNNAKLHMSKSVPKIYRDKIRMSMDQFPFGKVDGIDAWSYLYDETMMNPNDIQRFHQSSQVPFKRDVYKMNTNIG